MRISSIEAARPQQVAFKGSLSQPVKALLDSQTPNLLAAKKAGKIINKIADAKFDLFSQSYNIIVQKMSEFSYSTILSMKKMKNGLTRFYIEHPKSDYKFLLGDIKLRNRVGIDTDAFIELSAKLEKVNPFEVENKFCIQRHKDVPREIFKPEIEL